jgi:hypothetical protein
VADNDALRLSTFFTCPSSVSSSPVTHHVHILEMNGQSYRLKDSKGRRPSKARS